MTLKEEVLAACDLLELMPVYSLELYGNSYYALRFVSKKTNDYAIIERNDCVKSCVADLDYLELNYMFGHHHCKSVEEAVFTKALIILKTSKLTYDGKTIGPLNWSSLEELELKLVAIGEAS